MVCQLKPTTSAAAGAPLRDLWKRASLSSHLQISAEHWSFEVVSHLTVWILFILFIFYQEQIDIMEGIKDSQAQRMAENLGFLGPLKNQVPVRLETIVSDLFQKTLENLFICLQLPRNKIRYCILFPFSCLWWRKYFSVVLKENVYAVCVYICVYLGMCVGVMFVCVCIACRHIHFVMNVSLCVFYSLQLQAMNYKRQHSD